MFSHDIQNQGRFGLALVCDEVDSNLDKGAKNEEELENIFVTFLTMGFIKSTLVACGDDGFVSTTTRSYQEYCVVVSMGEREDHQKTLCS